MTKREVLTKIITAYISTGKGLPAVRNGRFFNECWVDLTEAICAAYPEKDKPSATRTTPQPPNVF